MGISASNYIVNNFSFPSTPSINVNINNRTTEQINSSVSSYLKSAENYANSYIKACEVRDYVKERLEKDMCESVGLASIDKVNNIYVANIKADNYFQEVAGTSFTFTNVASINSMYNKLNDLKENLFDDESDSEIEYGGSGWSTDKTMPVTVYDNKAIVVSSGILEENNVIFIKNAANSINDARTYTAYQEVNSSQTVKYTLNKVSSEWVIKNTEDEILKTSVNIDVVNGEEIVWNNPANE